MSNFEDWKKLQQQRLDERPISEKISGAGVGALELALAGITGAPAQIASGWEGIGRTLIGQSPKKVADEIQATQEKYTYTPRSPEGQQYQKFLDETVGEAFRGISSSMGDTAQERFNTPAYSAAMYSVPTAVTELLSLGLLKGLTGGTKLKTRSPQGYWMPTPELENALRARGLTFESLSPKVIAQIPEVLDEGLIPSSRKKDVTKAVLAEQAKVGGRQDVLAPYEMDGSGKKNPVYVEAIKQGYPEGIVQMIKTATPATRFGFLRMAKNMETYKGNFSDANDYRPLNIVGDSIGTRLIDLRKVANDRKVKLEQIVSKDLKDKIISPDPVYKNLTAKLDEYNIFMDRDKDTGKLYFDFSDSDIKLDQQSQRLINNLLEVIPDGEPLVGAKAHQIKKQLDGLINYEKINVGDVTPQGKSVLMAVRAGLNEAIRNVSKDYAAVNDDLSVILDSFSDIQDLAGKKIDIFDPETNAKSLGLLSRKLVTNYASQPLVEQSIAGLQKAADRFGLERGDNLTDLVTFANFLEKKHGTPVSGSFQGKIEAANERIVEAVQNPTWESAVAGAYKYGRDKIRGVNEENAFKALYELIRKGGK